MEKNKSKINLSTLLLILSIIVIIIMGYCIYKLYNNKVDNTSYTNTISDAISTELYIVK
jgi:uncharacterized protein (UPF0333 family)